MKKITLFFILIICNSALTFSQTSRYHRLRALGTSISTSERDAFCSGSNFSSRPLANWNIISVNPLEVGKIYRFFHFERERFEYFYVERFFNYATGDDGQTVPQSGVGNPIAISCPNPDSDGDGVPDSQDDCPNEAGPASNDGCPQPTGPGIIEVNRIVISNQQGSTIFDSADSDNDDPPALSRNQSYGFTVTLKNIGGQNRRPEFEHFFSTNNSLDVFQDCSVQSNARGSNIAPGSTATVSYSIFVDNNTRAGANQCFLGGGGFFLLYADTDLSNNPLITSLSFTFGSSAGRPGPIGIDPVFLSRTNLNAFDSEPYNIEIYDFSGQKVLSQKVSGKAEENTLIQSLPSSGIYIIKNGDATRKVYVSRN